MNRSISLELWDSLNLDHYSIINQVKSQKCIYDLTRIKEWSMLSQWIKDIADWRHLKLKHAPNNQIGVAGELLAACLLCKENDFISWLRTMAIDGNGVNTNRDILADWNEFGKNIEVKTINHRRKTLIIDCNEIIYPELLVIILSLNGHRYHVHSLTTDKVLEENSTIGPPDAGSKYLRRITARLNDLAANRCESNAPGGTRTHDP